MSLGHTGIAYLEKLWHTTTGCSFNCSGCWARDLVNNRLAGTMKGLPNPPMCGDSQGAFTPCFHLDRLTDPIRSMKPRIIGVSFLGDLFDLGITDEQIAAVFGVMASAPHHTFILLTKQTARMEMWFKWLDNDKMHTPFSHSFCCWSFADELLRKTNTNNSGMFVAKYPKWPLPNVWIGTSVSNQHDVDFRLPHLFAVPAAHRWVSVEPMKGPIDMWSGKLNFPDAVILGGMSGKDATPLDFNWVREVRDQCLAAASPFCFKQASGYKPEHFPLLDGNRHGLEAVPWMKDRLHEGA